MLIAHCTVNLIILISFKNQIDSQCIALASQCLYFSFSLEFLQLATRPFCSWLREIQFASKLKRQCFSRFGKASITVSRNHRRLTLLKHLCCKAKCWCGIIHLETYARMWQATLERNVKAKKEEWLELCPDKDRTENKYTFSWKKLCNDTHVYMLLIKNSSLLNNTNIFLKTLIQSLTT